MLLFTAHDPGSTNHIRPIYAHALKIGEAAEFADLASSTNLMDDDEALALVRSLRPEMLIAGSSANRGEWGLIRACKREGVKTAVIVDIGVSRKLDSIRREDFPHRFLVTNAACRLELIERGVPQESVAVTGSAHLEQLSFRRLVKHDFSVKHFYGLGPNSATVPFFCSPDTDKSIDALVSLATLLPATPAGDPAIILRPHPRTTHKERLESACRRFGNVHYDSGDAIDRDALLRASHCSLAMGSTVALESMVLGTPAAFYQIGWEYRQLDRNYRNIDAVPRIRTPEQLTEFTESAVDKKSAFISDDVEYYKGALGRIWEVLNELRECPG